MVGAELSRDACRAKFRDLFDLVCAPFTVIDPVEWVRTICRRPDSHGATQAQTMFSYAPYTREMFTGRGCFCTSARHGSGHFPSLFCFEEIQIEPTCGVWRGTNEADPLRRIFRSVKHVDALPYL
jgi:hypothetical protein